VTSSATTSTPTGLLGAERGVLGDARTLRGIEQIAVESEVAKDDRTAIAHRWTPDAVLGERFVEVDERFVLRRMAVVEGRKPDPLDKTACLVLCMLNAQDRT